jgi:hypothetical protein
LKFLYGGYCSVQPEKSQMQGHRKEHWSRENVWQMARTIPRIKKVQQSWFAMPTEYVRTPLSAFCMLQRHCRGTQYFSKTFEYGVSVRITTTYTKQREM